MGRPLRALFIASLSLAFILGGLACRRADTRPPLITGVSSEDIAGTTAIITWGTDEPSSSQVEYGLSEAYGLNTPADDALATSHSVTLYGIKPERAYHFRVKSQDAEGNEAASSDSTFTTSDMTHFDLIFKYGVGARNELNTFTGTYTKDMIVDPSITVNLSLSEEELDRIYQKMIEIGFFYYPDRFSVSVAPGELVALVDPHYTYCFKVERDGKVKELSWEAEILSQDVKAKNLTELVELITGIVESKEEYKNLPLPRGGYL